MIQSHEARNIGSLYNVEKPMMAESSTGTCFVCRRPGSVSGVIKGSLNNARSDPGATN